MGKSALAKEAGFTGTRYVVLFSHVHRLFAFISNVCPVHNDSPTNQLVCQVHLELIASQVLAQVLMPRVGLVTSDEFDNTIHSMQHAIKEPVEDPQVETIRLE
jgi:predicted ArsR family transcriptional regulator